MYQSHRKVLFYDRPSNLTTIILISCFVTSALSHWGCDDNSDEYSHVSTKINHQRKRISLQKCEEYKKFTYSEYTLFGSCKLRKNFNCETPTGLVSGGTECKENEFPHMAHLGYESDGYRNYVCGGALISEKFVLTAAHCKFDNKGRSPNIVRLNSVSENSTQALFRNIAEFIVHPEYKKSKSNDIALIRFSIPVNFQMRKLRPACLWTERELKNNTATVTGWGATDFADHSGSKNLLKAKLDLVDVENCQKASGKNQAEADYHICATDKSGGRKDSCQGDSGGPLQVIQPQDNPCMLHIIGVVSKGTVCGLNNSHGIYVKVSKFIDWIEQIVWNV